MGEVGRGGGGLQSREGRQGGSGDDKGKTED